MSMPLVKNVLKSKSYSISKIYNVVTLNAISTVALKQLRYVFQRLIHTTSLFYLSDFGTRKL
jgi:hypothetical protein